MLIQEEKITYFEKCLLDENHNDCMRDELHLYFFELENGRFDFLEKLNSKVAIENKINILVGKMMMHEHEDGLFNIIENYL